MTDALKAGPKAPVKTGQILGAQAGGVYRIRPHVNKWAWDLYKIGVANNWDPQEVPMSTDIEQWRSASVLTDAERLLVKRCLGFFAGSESLVADNLLATLLRFVQDPECRQYIGRQLNEELIHNHTLVYICDSLGLDEEEVYGAYQAIPAIKAKDDFLVSLTKEVGGDFRMWDYPEDPAAHPRTYAEAVRTRRAVLRNIITYYIVCEGTFFYSGFAMLLAFARENKLPGICKQIQFTVKDETNHVKFGTQLINTIIAQEPQLWSADFREEIRTHLMKTVELENAYAVECLPKGVLGLRSDLFLDYIRYIANRRLEGIGLAPAFAGARNPFPWMTEVIDLRKHANFFETTVTAYAKASTMVDDL